MNWKLILSHLNAILKPKCIGMDIRLNQILCGFSLKLSNIGWIGSEICLNVLMWHMNKHKKTNVGQEYLSAAFIL